MLVVVMGLVVVVSHVLQLDEFSSFCEKERSLFGHL